MMPRIKYFWIKYMERDKIEDVFYPEGKKVDAKELAEFIINNAYSNDIIIKEVREI